jgi:hypothetical protein
MLSAFSQTKYSIAKGKSRFQRSRTKPAIFPTETSFRWSCKTPDDLERLVTDPNVEVMFPRVLLTHSVRPSTEDERREISLLLMSLSLTDSIE